MNAIQEVKDENIKKIAQTLKNSGLASSETEAVRMATAMSKTNQKVSQNFDEKKDRNIMGLSFLNKEPPGEAPAPAKKVETTEEFIFGDVKETKETRKAETKEVPEGIKSTNDKSRKEDAFSVNNEFEEVITQDIIGAKAAPKQETTEPWHPPRPVTAPKQDRLSAPEPVHAAPAAPAPAHAAPSAPQGTPVSAAQSSQNAFSLLLGSAQKNAAYEEEVRKHAPQQQITQPTAVIQHKAVETQHTVVAEQQEEVSTTPAQAPRPTDGKAPAVPPSSTQTALHSVAQPAVSPQKKMMLEANVDITKMFNVNK
jgi:hypothetical protein